MISAHEYSITANLIEIADMMILNRPLGWSICAGMPHLYHGLCSPEHMGLQLVIVSPEDSACLITQQLFAFLGIDPYYPLDASRTVNYEARCAISGHAYTPFSDQLWIICMKFGKSATNFDIPAAESCPNGRRPAEMPKLHPLLPKCMHCSLNRP